MADANTRRLRVKVHGALETIWLNEIMQKHDAYKWLGSIVGRYPVGIAELTEDELTTTYDAIVAFIAEKGEVMQRRTAKKMKRKDKKRARDERTAERERAKRWRN